MLGGGQGNGFGIIQILLQMEYDEELFTKVLSGTYWNR